MSLPYLMLCLHTRIQRFVCYRSNGVVLVYTARALMRHSVGFVTRYPSRGSKNSTLVSGCSSSMKSICHKIDLFVLFDAHTPIHHYLFCKSQNCCRIKSYCMKKNGTKMGRFAGTCPKSAPPLLPKAHLLYYG